MAAPISKEEFEQSYLLGDKIMDQTHREFVGFVRDISGLPSSQIGPLFQTLFDHTRSHFETEEKCMQAIGHGLYAEHRANHQRILGDMERFLQRAIAGRGTMAKAWAVDSLMDWFSTHAKTMDSALAADLKEKSPERAELA